MHLKKDMASYDALYNTVSSFYQQMHGRRLLIFDGKSPTVNGDHEYSIRYLLDAKHVVEYKIASDRNFLLSILSLAIGPHYFPPMDFWDYANSQRFSLEASTEAIVLNLKLLDEFLEA